MNEIEIKKSIDDAIKESKKIKRGNVANYIPELSHVDPDVIQVAMTLKDGRIITNKDFSDTKFSLQSVSKLVVLIGLLEEIGRTEVFKHVRMEPSGNDFSSVARLDQFGPLPSNPMLNAGAISLSARIPGDSLEAKRTWQKKWMDKLFCSDLSINEKVFHSECSYGNRNRALAYLLKSNNVIKCDIETVMKCYFSLCSFEASVKEASYLPMLLANKGRDKNGQSIINPQNVKYVNALMATCGLYNESGSHFVKTGMPSKSGVSGFIVSVALGKAGVAVMSPKINTKGTSIRGEMILTYLSEKLELHFGV